MVITDIQLFWVTLYFARVFARIMHYVTDILYYVLYHYFTIYQGCKYLACTWAATAFAGALGTASK